MNAFRNITIISLTLSVFGGVVGFTNNFDLVGDRTVISNGETKGPSFAKPDENRLTQNSAVPATPTAATVTKPSSPTIIPTQSPTYAPVEEPRVPADPQPKNSKDTTPPEPAVPIQRQSTPVSPSPAPTRPRTVPAAPVQQKATPTASPTPTLTGQAWVDATMAKYGVYAPAGTQFIFGAMPATCPGADGCTVYSYRADGIPFNVQITLKPGVLSEYLLFHEIGHSKGVRDECAADNFARSVVGPVKGHYC